MAFIHPSLPLPRVAENLGLATELQVLDRLRQALPDAFTLFHSVDWMSPIDRGVARGEIDIVVVNQAGDLALIEVKGGTVDITAQGIFKAYKGNAGNTQRNVGHQVSMQYGYMRKRLAALESTRIY